MDYSVEPTHPVKGIKGLTTEYAAGALVIGSLVALIMLKRGFRGAKIPGVGSVNIG